MIIILLLFGIAFGSFLNCVIFRLEQEKSIKGRSYCPKCKHILSWKDLVPLFSFLFLLGRCRYCKEKISFQYPLVEFFTGIAFVFIYLNLEHLSGSLASPFTGIFANFFTSPGFGVLVSQYPVLVYYLMIASALIVIFAYDLKNFLIPDIALFPIIALAFIYQALSGNIVNAFLSGMATSLFFFFIFWITRGKGMGFGDVKLAFFLGIFLGFPNILAALFMAFTIGAIIGTGFIIAKKKTLKSKVPFGPFLIIGAIIALFWGKDIIQHYLSFF